MEQWQAVDGTAFDLKPRLQNPIRHVALVHFGQPTEVSIDSLSSNDLGVFKGKADYF